MHTVEVKPYWAIVGDGFAVVLDGEILYSCHGPAAKEIAEAEAATVRNRLNSTPKQ